MTGPSVIATEFYRSGRHFAAHRPQFEGFLGTKVYPCNRELLAPVSDLIASSGSGDL
jgi:hypothetical protein